MSKKTRKIKPIRHISTATPKETDEFVDSVAELIVNYIKKHGVPKKADSGSDLPKPENDK